MNRNINNNHAFAIKSCPAVVSAAFLILLIMVTSCATQKEKPAAGDAEKTGMFPQRVTRIETATSMNCTEDTSKIFNFSGIRVMPYLKLAFRDMNGDRLTDMIIGGKKGYLQLYRNDGYPSIQHWERVDGYFDGVKAGAFSAPAMGDLDGDGKPELVVGTGGFSSQSGRVLIFINKGSTDVPEWTGIDGVHMDTGDDAAPTIADYNFDGHPDIIAGNSEGEIIFYRNETKGGQIAFKRDKSVSVNKRFDKYAVPSAVNRENGVILIVGTSMGKLYRIDITKGSRKLTAKRLKIGLPSRRFLSPSFTNLADDNRHDLVISDGDGNIFYYENTEGNFTLWKQNHELFNNRLVAGPACAPTLANIDGKTCIIVGNIDGTFKVYEFNNRHDGIPWLERDQFLNRVKVSGFSRGVLTQWNEKEMFITGESNGKIRAFVNRGSPGDPLWKEDTDFFRGVQNAYHSTPVTFDLDNDGKWELITGSEKGRIFAYRMRSKDGDNPEWEMIPGMFDNIRVRGFSSPAFVRFNGSLYMFAGQENGEIIVFRAKLPAMDTFSDKTLSAIRFKETDFPKKIKMNNHSSPFAKIKDGHIELISGDYDGNIRHFVCNEG